MLLVVAGHLCRNVPPNSEWYEAFRSTIYAFHMCFFTYISGCVLARAYRPVRSLGDYGAYVKKRTQRLAPIYFGLGIFAIIGKMAVQRFVPVTNPPAGFLDALGKLFLDPQRSSLSQLWYLYMLIGLAFAMPLIMELTRCRPWLLLPAALVLRFTPLTTFLALNVYHQFLLAFLLGCWVGLKYDAWTRTLDRFSLIAICLFIASLGFLQIKMDDSMPGVIVLLPRVVVGVLALPALHALVRRKPFSESRLLAVLGKYTLVIYIMHPFVIGSVKAAFVSITPLDGMSFKLIAPVLLALGLAAPIVVKRVVFRRVAVLDRITD